MSGSRLIAHSQSVHPAMRTSVIGGVLWGRKKNRSHGDAARWWGRSRPAGSRPVW